MINPLSLLGSPTALKIGGFLLILALGYIVVDRHFASHERALAQKDVIISELQATVKVRDQQIAGLTIDKDRLKLSNSSLEGQISTLQESMDRVIYETKVIIESDHTYELKISELDRLVSDQVRNDRIAAIRESRKAELLLRFVNSNVECWIANFDKEGGRCVAGEWRNEITNLGR